MSDKICDDCGLINTDTARFCRMCGLNLNNKQKTRKLIKNRYSVIRVVKSGAMGCVFEAEDTKSSKVVAIKMMLDCYCNKDDKTYAQKCLEKEKEILAKVSHSGIPKIYDSLYKKNIMYAIVMDYVEGEDLETLLTKNGNFEEEEVIGISFQLAEILNYLHLQNPSIIYRDLKLSNVVYDVKNKKVSLIDFGISRKTGTATVVGTPGFASPEQYKGEATPKSDVYSLGMFMFCLLTGKHPHEFFNFKHDNSFIWNLIENMTENEPSKRISDVDVLTELGGKINLVKHNLTTIGKPIKTGASESNVIQTNIISTPQQASGFLSKYIKSNGFFGKPSCDRDYKASENIIRIQTNIFGNKDLSLRHLTIDDHEYILHMQHDHNGKWPYWQTECEINHRKDYSWAIFWKSFFHKYFIIPVANSLYNILSKYPNILDEIEQEKYYLLGEKTIKLDIGESNYYSIMKEIEQVYIFDSDNSVCEICGEDIYTDTFTAIGKQRGFFCRSCFVCLLQYLVNKHEYSLGWVDGVFEGGSKNDRINKITLESLSFSIVKIGDSYKIAKVGKYAEDVINLIPAKSGVIGKPIKAGALIAKNNIIGYSYDGKIIRADEHNTRSDIIFAVMRRGIKGDEDEFFHGCIEYGEINDLKKIFSTKQNWNVNMKNFDDDAPLHKIPREGKCNIEVYKKLIDYGADVNIRNNIGNTPMFSAVQIRNKGRQVMRMLIAEGANINTTNDKGQNPLHYAVLCGDVEIVKYLLDSGARIVEDANGISPLHIATTKRFKEIKILLQEKISRPAVTMMKGNAAIKCRNAIINTSLEMGKDKLRKRTVARILVK